MSVLVSVSSARCTNTYAAQTHLSLLQFLTNLRYRHNHILATTFTPLKFSSSNLGTNIDKTYVQLHLRHGNNFTKIHSQSYEVHPTWYHCEREEG